MERRVSSKLFYKDNEPLKFNLPNEPQAVFFKQKILEGGGQVTDSENADIIIYSKNISSNYPNVYSQDIIIESYFYNELQELSKYKIVIPKSEQKEKVKIATTQRIKKSRTEYTKEDDKLLVSFIKDCLYPKGKTIYKEMEEKYPHHSWQSWRERYIKVVGPALETGKWPTSYFGDKQIFEKKQLNRNSNCVNNSENNNTRNSVNHSINENINEEYNTSNNDTNKDNIINGRSILQNRIRTLNFVQSNTFKKGKTANNSDYENINEDNSDRIENINNGILKHNKEKLGNNKVASNHNIVNENVDNIEIEKDETRTNDSEMRDNVISNELEAKLKYNQKNKKQSSRDRRKLFYNNMDSGSEHSEDNTIPSIIQERRLYVKKKRSNNNINNSHNSNNRTVPQKKKLIVLPKNLLSNTNSSKNFIPENQEVSNNESERTSKNFVINGNSSSMNDLTINGKNSEETEKELSVKENKSLMKNNKDIENDNNNNINKIGHLKSFENNNYVSNKNNSNTKSKRNQNIKKSNNVDDTIDNSKVHTSDDDDNELQSYLNNYFSEKNIQKIVNKEKTTVISNNSTVISNSNNTHVNSSVHKLNTSTYKNLFDNNNTIVALNNNSINNKLNSNKEKKKLNNSNAPFELSSKFHKKNISTIITKDINRTVNNLIKINDNQRINKENLEKETTNDSSSNTTQINKVDDSINQNIPSNSNNNIHESYENDVFSKPTKENIYFSYSKFFSDNMDLEIPLSYSSIDYDNYLSKNIENTKKSILPKVSRQHKKIYIKHCLSLCKETHVSKQELYYLLHQCNGSLPATKALLKTKHCRSDEVVNSKLREWIWSKEEDEILLKSKDESQLKKIRLRKGNKSVRYRELYLEAKEIFQKLKNAETFS
ncbi:hypothetical protein PIROE2DRAFT_59006 [Piromyces sp. E2]|nr:hypothetical protein PIROE2DRAFT_59006 [Piromyces sp. E2]|eukprot:OUM67010.1 hypothetical protein PIROE2DRAFT_59006 [Piromyces sp. E2]